jgi:hypothetical protein
VPRRHRLCPTAVVRPRPRLTLDAVEHRPLCNNKITRLSKRLRPSRRVQTLDAAVGRRSAVVLSTRRPQTASEVGDSVRKTRTFRRGYVPSCVEFGVCCICIILVPICKRASDKSVLSRQCSSRAPSTRRRGDPTTMRFHGLLACLAGVAALQPQSKRHTRGVSASSAPTPPGPGAHEGPPRTTHRPLARLWNAASNVSIGQGLDGRNLPRRGVRRR